MAQCLNYRKQLSHKIIRPEKRHGGIKQTTPHGDGYAWRSYINSHYVSIALGKGTQHQPIQLTTLMAIAGITWKVIFKACALSATRSRLMQRMVVDGDRAGRGEKGDGRINPF